MGILKAVLVLSLVAYPTIACASENRMEVETKRQRAFLESLSSSYSSSEVQSRIDTVVRVGDDLKQHRAFLGLADQTQYVPSSRVFRFLYFKDNEFQEGHWKLEILVDEKLKITQVVVYPALQE